MDNYHINNQALIPKLLYILVSTFPRVRMFVELALLSARVKLMDQYYLK